MRIPGFVGPTYRLQSPVVGAERSVNLYVQRDEIRDGRPSLLLTPGVSPAGFANISPGRACFAQDGRAFIVNGNKFMEVFASGVVTERGTVDEDGNPTQIASNGGLGNQVAISSGGKVYIYNLVTNAFSHVFTGATHVAFLDGYFIAFNAVTGIATLSALNNGLLWTGGSLTRSSASDRWISMVVTHREIWFLGSRSTEPWINTGASTVFEPVSGAFIAEGTAAMYAATMFDNAVAWLGQSGDGAGRVFHARGYSPQRISTHAVELALQSAASLDDAVFWSYEMSGHAFLVVSVPSARMTFVYDAATGLWHERGLWVPSEMDYQAWRPHFHMYAFGKHLVGDRAGATIWQLRPDVFTDADGAGIRWMRRAPVLSAELVRLFVPRLELEVDTGVGLPSGQGSDPEVMQRLSWDGGRTFGTERKAKVGNVGQYANRVAFTRNGSGRRLVPEYSGSDPIPWRVVDLYGTVQRGNH